MTAEVYVKRFCPDAVAVTYCGRWQILREPGSRTILGEAPNRASWAWAQARAKIAGQRRQRKAEERERRRNKP